MKKLKMTIGVLVGCSVLALVLVPSFGVVAETVVTPPTVTTGGGEVGDSLDDIFTNLLKWAGWIYTLILALALIYFAWGGIMYLTAGGEPEKTALAQKQVLNGILGIAVIIGIGFVIALIASALGLTIPTSGLIPFGSGTSGTSLGESI